MYFMFTCIINVVYTLNIHKLRFLLTELPKQDDVCSHHWVSGDLYPVRYHLNRPTIVNQIRDESLSNENLHKFNIYRKPQRKDTELMGEKYPINCSLKSQSKMLLHFYVTLLPWPPKGNFIKHVISHKIPSLKHDMP